MILTNLMLLKALYIYLKELFFVKTQGNVTKNKRLREYDMTYLLTIFTLYSDTYNDFVSDKTVIKCH